MSVRSFIDNHAELFRFRETVGAVLFWNAVAILLGVGAVVVGLEYASQGLVWSIVGAVLILSGVTGLANFAWRELL